MLDPFLLERRLVPKVWGGHALSEAVGVPIPPGSDPIGESWELFDRPDGSSKLRGSDVTLADLVRRHPDELVGHGVPRGHEGSFPLMIKFLDARRGLSLQVHPDNRQASGDMGKDECCLILAVDEGARVVHGVRRGVERDAFLASLESPAVEEMLYSFEPEVGDLVHIPPGTPHGIGPGVIALEIQQNSDQTYRFYDWGRGRETHPAKAASVLQMVVNDRPPVGRPTSLADGGELLIATDQFVVRRYEVERRIELPTSGRFLTATCLSGECRLRWGHGDYEGDLRMGRADTALVPACTPFVAVEPDGSIDLIVCDPGGR